MSINGLAFMNVELTSRCNKNCWMCGRRERDKKYKTVYGDMPFSLVERIARMTPSNITVQLHNNGEGLLYPRFGDAVYAFAHCKTGLVSNGKLLCEKADELIDKLDYLSVSVFEGDEEWESQLNTLEKFLAMKGSKKPYVTLRFIGVVGERTYAHLKLQKVHRVLHRPEGSVEYQRVCPVPEIGVCWDLLTHLSIDIFGNVSPCVRYDPEHELIIGNVHSDSLEHIWNGERRRRMLNYHCRGMRDRVSYCGSHCDYWGIPVDSRR